MSVDVQSEVSTFLEYLDILETDHADLFEEVASFVMEQIVDRDIPETYAVATAYIKWATKNPEFVRGVKPTHDCSYCNFGWAEYADGSVYPCTECRPADHSNWHMFFVDQNRPPS